VSKGFNFYIQVASKYTCLGAWTSTTANVGHGLPSVTSVYARG